MCDGICAEISDRLREGFSRFVLALQQLPGKTAKDSHSSAASRIRQMDRNLMPLVYKKLEN